MITITITVHRYLKWPDNMELSPEQFDSLKRGLSEPASKVAAALNLPMGQIETVLKTLEGVARRRATALGSERLMVIRRPVRSR